MTLREIADTAGVSVEELTLWSKGAGCAPRIAENKINHALRGIISKIYLRETEAQHDDRDHKI